LMTTPVRLLWSRCRVRISAEKGYTGFRIQVSDQYDSYLRLRLGNKETTSLLKEKLGDGFSIAFREIHGE
ncbi:hypothetical protein FDX20_28905, partial [Citrobacter sp. TBCS-11]